MYCRCNTSLYTPDCHNFPDSIIFKSEGMQLLFHLFSLIEMYFSNYIYIYIYIYKTLFYIYLNSFHLFIVMPLRNMKEEMALVCFGFLCYVQFSEIQKSKEFRTSWILGFNWNLMKVWVRKCTIYFHSISIVYLKRSSVIWLVMILYKCACLVAWILVAWVCEDIE